jgi:hypothetical protein
MVLSLVLGCGLSAVSSAADDVATRRVAAVNVLDKTSTNVRGLTASSFRVRLGGKPVEVLAAAIDATPARSPS